MDSSKQAEQLKQEVAAYQSQLKLLREELNDLSKSSLNHLPQRILLQWVLGAAVETYQLVTNVQGLKDAIKTWNWSSRAATLLISEKNKNSNKNAKTWNGKKKRLKAKLKELIVGF